MFDRFCFCLCLWHLVGVFGDTDTETSVSVMEGDSVTLQTHVTEIQTGDEIDWTFGANRDRIGHVYGRTIKIHDVVDDRFRDRLKLDQTGSLTITNTRTTHSGLYEVEISRSRSEEKHRFNVTVFVHEDETQAAAKLYKHTGLMTESDVTEVIYTCFITEQ